MSCSSDQLLLAAQSLSLGMFFCQTESGGCITVLLNAGDATLQLYILLFTAGLLAAFIGARMWYRGVIAKDEYLLRKARMLLLFAIIGLLCIAVVSVMLTGRFPA